MSDIQSLEGEEWVDIKGYEGHYQASSLGRIRSAGRYMPHSTNSQQFIKSKVLKQRNHCGKYSSVMLYLENGSKNYLTHRLIAESFIPNPENKPTVNHKNGIKTDNRVVNLEWATQLENNNHALSTGLKLCPNGSNNISKLTKDQIIEIRGIIGMSQYQIAEMFGVTQSSISMIVNRKVWTHI